MWVWTLGRVRRACGAHASWLGPTKISTETGSKAPKPTCIHQGKSAPRLGIQPWLKHSCCVLFAPVSVRLSGETDALTESTRERDETASKSCSPMYSTKRRRSAMVDTETDLEKTAPFGASVLQFPVQEREQEKREPLTKAWRTGGHK